MKWLIAMLGAAMTISTGALAQTSMSAVPNFYVGAEIGNADIGSDDDTGIKFLGGYQFHRNFAAELGLGMLYDKGGREVTSLEVVGLGIFPVTNQFSIIGKLGFARLEADPGGSDTDLTFGFGVQYDFSRKLGFRLQWQTYNTDPDVDFLSLGVVWRF